jgi:hypothetical protein
MSQRQNVYAYTPPGFYPPYLSINLEESGEYSVHVRGPKKDEADTTQPHASINLGAQIELVNMFDSLGQHLFGETVMALMSQALFNLSSLSPEEIAALAAKTIPLAEKIAQS